MSTPRIFEIMSTRARKTAVRTVDASLHGMSVPTASATAGVTSATREPRLYTSVFTFSSVAVSLTDATTNGAQGSIQFADLPQGAVRFMGATCDLALAIGTGIATAILASVGTTAAANDNATLTTTEANIIPSTSCAISASAASFKGESTGTEGATTIDGTGTAADLFLNLVATDANTTGSGPFTVTVTGTITVTWMDLGDN